MLDRKKSKRKKFSQFVKVYIKSSFILILFSGDHIQLYFIFFRKYSIKNWLRISMKRIILPTKFKKKKRDKKDQKC